MKAAGSNLQHVLRCGVFLVDMREFQKMNGVYSRMFGAHRPARTTIGVAALPGEKLRVEIDAVTDVGGIMPHLGGESFRYDPLPAKITSRRRRLRFIYFDGKEVRPLAIGEVRALGPA